MRLFGTVCLFLLFGIVCGVVHVRQYAEREDLPNQYLVWDDDDTYILVDSGNGSNTDNILDWLASFGASKLRAIFLTSGQPDQFLGVPEIVKAHPEAYVTVATYEIYDELQEEAALYPSTSFSWQNDVRVISDDDTLDEVELKVFTNFPPAQSEAFSILYHEAQNWVITGNLLNVNVHADLGAPLDLVRLNNWSKNVLNSLLATGDLGFDINTVFYPGYGAIGNEAAVNEMQNYLNFFEYTILACQEFKTRPTLKDVEEIMIATYPTYANSDILKEMTRNSAWEDAQAVAGVCPYYYSTFEYVSVNSSNFIEISCLLIISLVLAVAVI